MKSLILLVCLMVFSIGCSDYGEVTDYNSEVCERYTDLCEDGGSDVYSVCADEYGSWFAVYGVKYYTAEYMLQEECDF